MKVDPFIEAENAADHSVKRACELLQVSRSAYNQRAKNITPVRARTDAELTEKIIAIHTTSKGTYGWIAEDPPRAPSPRNGLRKTPGHQADAPCRPRRAV